MTEIQPAHFTQGACHTAQGDRLMLASLVCAEGVAMNAGGALEVTSGGSGLDIEVAEGSAFIEGTDITWQGTYHVSNDAPVTLTLDAADPTDPRVDRIILHVYDAQYAGALNEWHIEALTGTPSPAPVGEPLPDNSLLLAEVVVAGGAVGPILAGSITDRRVAYALCDDSQQADKGLREVVKVTATGNFLKASYPWLRGVRVRVQAAGGAGGGSDATAAGEHSKGGGGGGGGYAESYIPVGSLGASETVTIGAGGVGVAGGNGGNGGNSSFGAHVAASGGSGGASAPSTSVTTGTSGGAGGDGTAGDLRTGGTAGGNANGSGPIGISGIGGASRLGGGALSRQSNVGGNALAGLVGKNYGGGGSGALSTQSAGSAAGGNGAPGIVLVELYG